MTIKLRAVGFHAPVTLPEDAVKYCVGIQAVIDKRNKELKKSEPHFTIPGNSADDLKKVQASAQALAPKAARIKELEAELSLAYQAYDKDAVETWKLFSEARDYARQYGENHDHADVSSVADEYVYHAGRAARASSKAGTAPTKPV